MTSSLYIIFDNYNLNRVCLYLSHTQITSDFAKAENQEIEF